MLGRCSQMYQAYRECMVDARVVVDVFEVEKAVVDMSGVMKTIEDVLGTMKYR